MTESEKLGELFDEAQAVFDRRDWTAAIDRLEKVVRINPDQPGALKLLEEAHKRRAAHSKYLIGLGCRHRKQWARAIEELEMALRDDPDHHDAKVELKEVTRLAKIDQHLSEADECRQKSEWEQVEIALQAALKLDPDSEEIKRLLDDAQCERIYQVGIQHIEARRWRAAQESLDELQERRPGYKELSSKLGEIERQLRWEKLYSRAREYEEAGNWPRAIDLYDQIYGQNPDYEGVVEHLAICRRRNQGGQESGGAGQGAAEQGSADQWSLSIEWKWLLLAIGLSGVGVLTCRRQLHCLLCYKLTEVSLVIILGVGGVLVARFAKLLPPDKRAILESLTTGICLVFFGFIVSVVLLPDPSREECSSTLPMVMASVQTPLELFNGDFADGFEYWQHGGELDQTVKCNGSQCYAVLGNPDYPCYYGMPVGEAWIRQTFEVPQVMSPTLSLRYRVFSYDLDLPGYDYFQVAINGVLLADRYGNYEWSEPSCSRDAWDSGWRTLTLDLGDYRGEKIAISFHNFNGTQPYHNTWTYVDNVRVARGY